MATLFDQLRARIPDYAGMSDEQILHDASSTLGASPEELGQVFGYKPPGDFMRGMYQAGHQLVGSAEGLVGMAGAMTGADSLKKWGLDAARARFDRADAYSKPSDDVTNLSWENAGPFLKHGLGYVAGQVAPMLVSGGVGSFLAKRAAQVGVKTASKEAVEAAVMAGVPREVAVQEIARQVATPMMEQAVGRGALTGAGAASYMQEAGSIYPEQIKQGHDNPWLAAGMAVPAAAMDVVGELPIMNKFFKGAMPGWMGKAFEAPEGAGFLRARGSAALKNAGLEAATEGIQTGMERYGSYQPLTGDDANSDYLNSMALGALGGGVFGAALGAHHPGESKMPVYPGLNDGKQTVDLMQPAEPAAPRPVQDQMVQQELFGRPAPTPDGYVYDQGIGSVFRPQPVQEQGAQEKPFELTQATDFSGQGQLPLATNARYQLAAPTTPTKAPIVAARDAFVAAGGTPKAWLAFAKKNELNSESPTDAVADAVLQKANDQKTMNSAPWIKVHETLKGTSDVQSANPQSGSNQNVVVRQDEAGQGAVRPGVEGQLAEATAQPGQPGGAVPGSQVVRQERGTGQEEVALPADTSGLQLTKAQQPIADHMLSELKNGHVDNLVDAKGVFKYAEIGEAVGKARGSVKHAVNQIATKLARAQGMTMEQLRDKLREEAARGFQTADEDNLGLSPDHQNQYANEADIFGGEGAEPSMGVINSVGGSQGDIGGNEQPHNYVDSVEPSENTKAHAEQERAKATLPEKTDEAAVDHTGAPIRDVDTAEALEHWRELDGTELPKQLETQWTKLWIANQDGVLNDRHFQEHYVTLSKEADELRGVQAAPERDRSSARAEPAKVEREPSSAPAAVRAEPAAEPAGKPAEPSNPLERRVAAYKEQVGPKQAAAIDKLVDRYSKGEIDFERLNDELDNYAEQIEDGVHYSEGGAKNPTTSKSIVGAVKAAFFSPARMDAVVRVYDTVEQAKEADPRAFSQAKDASKVQAFIGTDGKVHLIAENIEKGHELGVFLHEVGVHLGMEKLVGKTNMEWLAQQVDRWAAKNDNSVEARIAKEATARAETSSSADKTEEKIAYMVEGLVREGVTPQAEGMTEGHRWFRKLWAAAKAALRKLGIQNPGKFTGQHLVDMAYGAADLELEGTWHGTAADFRNFNHEYMGSGEGAQAFGWGTYLAQRVGIAKEYWRADVGRKAVDPRTKSMLNDIIKAREYEIADKEKELQTKGMLPAYYANREKAIARLKREIEDIKRTNSQESPEGSLMRVAANVRDHEMLDWDKPLSEQSDHVQQVMAKAFYEAGLADNHATVPRLKAEGRKRVHWLTGSEAYHMLKRDIGSAKLTSEYLDSLGIKGIKFLDSRSRDLPEESETRKLMDEAQAKANAATDAHEKRTYQTLANEYAKRLDRTRNLVIFNDKNIVRAMTEVGADRNRVKFSEATGDNPFTAGIMQEALGAATDSAKTWLKQKGLGWLTLEQIGDVTKSAAVKAYQTTVHAMQSMANQIVAKASRIESDWAKVRDQQQLSRVMREATRMQFDPDVDAPTTPEQHALKSRFAAMEKTAQETYRKVRDFYADNLTERRAIMDELSRLDTSGKARAELDKLYGQLKGPYFPLARLGQWYAVGMSPEMAALKAKVDSGDATAAEQARFDKLHKDQNHYISTAHTYEWQAKFHAKEYQQKLGEGYHNIAKVKSDVGISNMPELAPVRAALEEGLGKEAADKLDGLMSQLYFDLLPEGHALKQQMKRQGIYGEEEDMRRVFAATAMSQAHYISRLKYSHDLSDAMMTVEKEGGGGNHMGRFVHRELQMRNNIAMDRQTSNPLVDALINTSGLAHLGGSAAFYLTNMMQVPMMSLPWLAARHGFNASRSAIQTAYADAFRIIKGSAKEHGWTAELDWKGKDGLQGNEAKLFQAALERNLLDITLNADLSAVRDMQNQKLRDVMTKLQLPVHVTELMNRSVVLLSAYRLTVAKGQSHESAVAHALKAVEQTQFDYSGLNAPRHFQSVMGSKQLARMAFQFRKYQQASLFLTLKSMYDAVAATGKNAEETKQLRKEARDTFVGLCATSGLMAGVTGLPFAGTALLLASVVGGLGSDDDEPFDAEVAMRNWLADTFGKEVGASIAKGLPMAGGVDVSGRLGMKDIANPLTFMRQGKTGTETVNNAFATLLGGAPLATLADMADGIHTMGTGQWAKGAEKLVPLKAASNLIRAGRYNTQGMSDKNGETILPSDRFSGWDLTLRAIGFQPTKESEYYAANQAVQEAKQAVTDKRSSLLREYAQERLKGSDTSDVEQQIAEFNDRHTEKNLRIDASAKLKAVQTHRKLAEQRNETGVRTDKATRNFSSRGDFAAP